MIPDTENTMNSFRNLADNKIIVCLTKGSENEMQATFCHSILRKSFTDKKPTCLALTGFGSRAIAIRLAPWEIFDSKPERKVPPFREMLKCQKEEDVRALKGEKKKIDNYAIIPPFLASELFDEDELNPMKIFLKMLKQTRRLIKKTSIGEKETDDEGEEMEVLEVPDLGEDDLELTPSDPEPVDLEPLTETAILVHALEPSFGRIFDFLYLLAVGDKGLKPVTFKVCTREATNKWSEEQHEKCCTTSQPNDRRRPTNCKTD